jgi:predicted nucleic acid-binding protein
LEAGRLELISSEVLLFEVSRNPQLTRQEYALEVLAKAKTVVPITEVVELRSREFLAYGIKPLDALHLASAEVAQADYFCTCDDILLAKAENLPGYAVKVVSPLVLIKELEP